VPLPPFVPFGVAHLAALLVVAVVCSALTLMVRRRPASGGPVRLALALAIVLLVAFEVTMALREGWFDWRIFVPLELCDAAIVLAIAGLLAPRPRLAEVLYFWTGAGSVLAMLTPVVRYSFPRWEFVVFFGLHGLVLASALVLVFGLGLRPRPGAPVRVFLVTAAWTALVGLVDRVLGTNYMFLRHKPEAATVLDWMGPWPVYIGTAAALALALFWLLALPFRREWRTARRA